MINLTILKSSYIICFLSMGLLLQARLLRHFCSVNGLGRVARPKQTPGSVNENASLNFLLGNKLRFCRAPVCYIQASLYCQSVSAGAARTIGGGRELIGLPPLRKERAKMGHPPWEPWRRSAVNLEPPTVSAHLMRCRFRKPSSRPVTIFASAYPSHRSR